MNKILATMLVGLTLTTPVWAQDHSHHGGAAAAQSAATQALEAVNQRMHSDMAVEWTGDPDVDFLKAMIPHHRGAVEMARVVLQYGADAEIKALAEQIIADQEAEIAQMEALLAKHGQ